MSKNALPNINWIKVCDDAQDAQSNWTHLSDFLKETAFSDRIYANKDEITNLLKMLITAIEAERPIDVYRFTYEFFIKLRCDQEQTKVLNI